MQREHFLQSESTFVVRRQRTRSYLSSKCQENVPLVDELDKLLASTPSPKQSYSKQANPRLKLPQISHRRLSEVEKQEISLKVNKRKVQFEPSKCAKSLWLQKVKLRRLVQMKPPPRWGILSKQLIVDKKHPPRQFLTEPNEDDW